VNGYNHLVSGKAAERREKTMALVKKGKKVEKPGYPSAFVALVEKAATLQDHSEIFRGAFRLDQGRDCRLRQRREFAGDCQRREKGSNPKV